MAGFGQNRKAIGVHDPLKARAVVLRHGKQRLALVCVDLVGFFQEYVTHIRKQLADFHYVAFALHGGSLLTSPLDSSQFMSWGRAGQGRWMTILTNPGHAYLDVAGLRLDTSAADDPKAQQGPRWRPLRPANAGYVIRHPAGL